MPRSTTEFGATGSTGSTGSQMFFLLSDGPYAADILAFTQVQGSINDAKRELKMVNDLMARFRDVGSLSHYETQPRTRDPQNLMLKLVEKREQAREIQHDMMTLRLEQKHLSLGDIFEELDRELLRTDILLGVYPNRRRRWSYTG